MAGYNVAEYFGILEDAHYIGMTKQGPMKILAVRHCASATDLIIDLELIFKGSLGSRLPLGTGLFGQESCPPPMKPKTSRASDFGLFGEGF